MRTKRGRPQLYTDEDIVAALRSSHGLVYLAAKRLGCRPATIYDRAKVSPPVAECIADQRGELIDVAEQKLFAAVRRGQPWAIGMVLKTLGRDRGYVERTESRIGGDKDAPPVQHDHGPAPA